jgi:hypothetical protein
VGSFWEERLGKSACLTSSRATRKTFLPKIDKKLWPVRSIETTLRPIRDAGVLRERVKRGVVNLRVDRFAGLVTRSQFGEHIALANVGGPSRPELKMGLVLDGSPIAAALQFQVSS